MTSDGFSRINSPRPEQITTPSWTDVTRRFGTVLVEDGFGGR